MRLDENDSFSDGDPRDRDDGRGHGGGRGHDDALMRSSVRVLQIALVQTAELQFAHLPKMLPFGEIPADR